MNKRTHMNFSTLNLALVALFLISGKTKAQSPALVQAIKLTDNEQFDKASSAFKNLIAKDAENADTYFYFGENLLAAEQTDSAEILFKKGIEIAPKAPLNHIGLAKVYRVRGKNAEAQTSFDAAFNLFTEKGVKIKDEMKVRAYVEGAECLLLGSPKNTNKALELVKKALELDENNVAAYIAKGDALYEADQLNVTDALAAYKTASELDKSSPKAVSKMAFMWFRTTQWKRSIALYDDAIKIDPNFAPAYNGRGTAKGYDNQIEEGLKDLKKYLELNQGSTSARIRYAGFLFIAKKYDECLAEISAIEKIIGTEHVLLNRLKAYVLYEKGDYANALKAMEFYMKKQESSKINATDYEYLGRIHGKLGNDAERDKYLEKAIDMEYRTKSPIINEIITIYKEKKDNAKLIYWYQKKTMNGSKDVNDWFYMGLAANKIDRHGLTDTAFTEYVKVMPDYALAYYYIGHAKDGADTLEPKKWDAKAAFETFFTKLKPEEIEKNNTKVSEAYFFYARYYIYSDKPDLGLAKCYLNKIISINASEYWVGQANALMNAKGVAAATVSAECK